MCVNLAEKYKVLTVIFHDIYSFITYFTYANVVLINTIITYQRYAYLVSKNMIIQCWNISITH